MAPCKNCLFNTHAEGCPTDGGAPCTFTNKWRKFIPKDITNPTYDYSYDLPETSKYMAVHELKGETWMHTVPDDGALKCDLNTEPVPNHLHAVTYFDRAGNVVGRILPAIGHIKEDT